MLFLALQLLEVSISLYSKPGIVNWTFSNIKFIEPNGTHPKVFPIEHNQTCGNRTPQQSNVKPVSSGFKQGVVGGSSWCKKERGGQGIQPPLACLPLVRPFFLVPKYFQAPTAMQASNEPVVLVMTIWKCSTLLRVFRSSYGVLF